jgi:hypothetical protein
MVSAALYASPLGGLFTGLGAGAGFSFGQRWGYERAYPAFQQGGPAGLGKVAKQDMEALLRAVLSPNATPLTEYPGFEKTKTVGSRGGSASTRPTTVKKPTGYHPAVKQVIANPPTPIRQHQFQLFAESKQDAIKKFYASKGKRSITGISQHRIVSKGKTKLRFTILYK